jgi:hypothetical protein
MIARDGIVEVLFLVRSSQYKWQRVRPRNRDIRMSSRLQSAITITTTRHGPSLAVTGKNLFLGVDFLTA